MRPFFLFTLLTLASTVVAQDQRAKPPTFNEREVSRVFFSDLSEAIRGERPTLANLRSAGKARQAAVAAAERDPAADENQDLWSGLISPSSLEDEVKRIKLRFDSVITTPGAFNGGGYQDARLNLTVLASLFAIISEYSGKVRWQEHAAPARDLIARTARNCAAGSTQVFNEAKLRKADLQDILSGTGLSTTNDSPEPNDWSMIADRSPVMEYAEELLDELSDRAVDANSAKENADSVRRMSELLAVLGEILVQEGMDDYDDTDYALLSRQMTKASRSVADAIERQDFEAVRSAVGAITQSCADCHEQYR